MSKWRIQPEQVQKVLESTQEPAEDMSDALDEDDIERIAEDTYVKSLQGDEVVQALGNVLKGQKENIENVFSTVQAGALGVMNATISYNKGQTEMAGTFQTQMTAAAESGDLTYLEDHNQA
jgi:uncharacterized membrane-anchored protein YjiN (DUF445 family)